MADPSNGPCAADLEVETPVEAGAGAENDCWKQVQETENDWQQSSDKLKIEKLTNDLEIYKTKVQIKIEKLKNDLEIEKTKVQILELELKNERKASKAKDKKMMSDGKLVDTIKKLVAGSRPEPQPQPSGSVAAKGQRDKNFHLKVHFSKKAVIADDKRGQIFEETESAHEARNRKRREQYAQDKQIYLARELKRKENEKENEKGKSQPNLEDPEVTTTASGASSAASGGSSGSRAASPAAGVGQHSDDQGSDDTADGEPPSKKWKRGGPSEGDTGDATIHGEFLWAGPVAQPTMG